MSAFAQQVAAPSLAAERGTRGTDSYTGFASPSVDGEARARIVTVASIRQQQQSTPVRHLDLMNPSLFHS